MKCPACGFENMRGTERCISCRARLMLADTMPAGVAVPPRAGKTKWLLPFRRAGNLLRQRLTTMVPAPMAWLARQLNPLDDLPSESVAAIYMSLVPGLGHLMGRRWRAGLLWGGVWAILLLMALGLWGGPFAWILAGLPLSWHVSAMADAGQVRRWAKSAQRHLRLMMLHVFLPCFILYAVAFVLVNHFFQVADSLQATVRQGIRQGDTLLFQRLSRSSALRQGDLVVLGWSERRDDLFGGNEPYRQGEQFRFASLSRTIRIPHLAQVLAFPGDQVEISGRQVKVNGVLLPMDLTRAWQWEAPPAKFASPRLETGSVLLFDGFDILQKPRNSIESRVRAIWFPLARRQALPRPDNATIKQGQ